MAGRRPAPDHAAHQGTGRFISVLAATEAYRKTGSEGTRPAGRLPRAPAVQCDVQAAPGASGAVPGVFPSRDGTSSHRPEPQEPQRKMDEHLATVPRVRSRNTSEAEGRRGHLCDRLLRSQEAVARGRPRPQGHAGLGEDARCDRDGQLHRAQLRAHRLERAREPDVR